MNRFGIIEKVSDIIISEFKRNSEYHSLVRSISICMLNDPSYSRVIGAEEFEEFLQEHELDLTDCENEEDKAGVVNVIHNFLLNVESLPEYNSGEKLLRYYLYYKYSEQHPVEVLKMDAEFIKFHKSFETEIVDDLSDWLAANDSENTLLGTSIQCKAMAFVLSNAMVLKSEETSCEFGKLYNSCISDAEGRRLLDFYSGEYDAATAYTSIRQELLSKLGLYMSPSTIRSTPITVSALYYAYMWNIGSDTERNMYTRAQGINATNAVKLICNDFRRRNKFNVKDDDVVNIFKIYKDVINGDFRSGEETCLSKDIYHMLCRGSRLQSDAAFKNYEDISLIVAEKLTEFMGDMKDREMVEEYTTSELLTAYIFCTGTAKLAQDYLKSPVVARCVSENRKLLPTVLQELSDAGVLIILIMRLYSGEHRDYYRGVDLSQVLTSKDIEILEEIYSNVSGVLQQVKYNLSRVADDYWLAPNAGALIESILVRCVSITDYYRKNSKYPVLSIVSNRDEFRESVEIAVHKFRSISRLKKNISSVGVLVAMVISSDIKAEGGTKLPMDKFKLSTDDVQNLILLDLARSESDVYKKINEHISALDVVSYNIDIDIRKLTVIDQMKLYIYCMNKE